MPTTRTIDNGALTDMDIAVDVVGARDYQYVKLAHGLDGVATILSAVNPLPTSIIGAPPVARDVDAISTSFQFDKIMQGLTPRDVKHAAVSASALGNNTIVAAVAGLKILPLHCLLIPSAAVGVKFKSGAAGADLTGNMPLDVKGGFEVSFMYGFCDPTGTNTLLNLVLDTAVPVGGVLTYAEIL